MARQCDDILTSDATRLDETLRLMAVRADAGESYYGGLRTAFADLTLS
jgi:hypothetical protein